MPSPLLGLEQAGVRFRRGQVSLLCAASGGMKSAVATHLVVHGRYPDDSAIPTLYFSADTDKVTLGTRIAASIVDKPLDMIEKRLRQGDEALWEAVANRTSDVWFSWHASPEMEYITEELEAYAYANGDWPWLVVVDNLINVDDGGEAGHQQKDQVMSFLQQVANYTNAHVMVLHHVTKGFESGEGPIPKGGLLDSVAKRPRLVLTQYRPGPNVVRVSVVKNSMGRADAQGNYFVDLAVMPERMWIKG